MCLKTTLNNKNTWEDCTQPVPKITSPRALFPLSTWSTRQLAYNNRGRNRYIMLQLPGRVPREGAACGGEEIADLAQLVLIVFASTWTPCGIDLDCVSPVEFVVLTVSKCYLASCPWLHAGDKSLDYFLLRLVSWFGSLSFVLCLRSLFALLLLSFPCCLVDFVVFVVCCCRLLSFEHVMFHL